MKKLILDGKNIKDKEGLYTYLAQKIDIEDDNLDSVYAYFARLTEDTALTFLNVQELKNELGNYGGSLIKMIQKAEKRNRHLKVRMVYQAPEKKAFKEKKPAPKKEECTKKPEKKGCPYAKKCGGCNGLKKSYEEELGQKQRWAETLLGKLTNVDDILGMENPLHYRHKVHAAFSYDRRGNIIAGVYEQNSHRVVDIDSCMIEDETAGKIIRSIKELCGKFRIKAYDEDLGTGVIRHVLIRTGFVTGEILVVLVTGTAIFPVKNLFLKELLKRHPEITTVVQNLNDKKTSMVLGDRQNIWYGRGYIEDELCGKRFGISPKSFYQVNPKQTEVLYRTAMECAGLTGKEKVIDAYCGIGTIGIIAAEQAGQVLGVELNRDAVRDAKLNAKRNGTDNIRFFQGDAGRLMTQMAAEGEHADVVFMDPPRSGSSEEFLDAVAKLSPEKVVYISCNPETMERDLVYLMKYQYKIKACRPVDLFPWTEHIEAVVKLVRKTPDV